jgi:RNA polymerase sigma-70 factor, ECF subfamily
MDLDDLVTKAAAGDLVAYGHIVQLTQHWVHGLVRRCLGDGADSADAVQEIYLRAFRRLRDLREPAAFSGWLRRIAVNTAASQLRRAHWVRLDDDFDVPVLDEEEHSWGLHQRQRLSQALLHLTAEDRTICDRFYHGAWSVARLAADVGTSEAAMRKRLQRIRDKLREEIEMGETTEGRELPERLPEKIVELLARPKLTSLPENPVGAVWRMVRERTPDYEEVQIPEVVRDAELVSAFGHDLADALTHMAGDGVHRIDEATHLRTDLTRPLLFAMKGRGGPLKITTAGKTYRAGLPGPMRLEAFHQGELLLVEADYSAWQFMDTLLGLLGTICPGHRTRIEETKYAFCNPAWEIAVEVDGTWREVLGWGRYVESVVRWIGCDPNRFTAVGVGLGLERLASIRYGIDDVRRIDAMRIDGGANP